MSRAKFALLALALSVCAVPVHASWLAPFISELHYDNEGKDVGEFVAVTGPSGLDLSGWELVLYNGGDGRPYGAVELNGVLDSAAGGLAEAAWPFVGIQTQPFHTVYNDTYRLIGTAFSISVLNAQDKTAIMMTCIQP